MLEIKYHLGKLSYVYTFRGRVCKVWATTKKYRNVLKEVANAHNAKLYAACAKDKQPYVCQRGDVVLDYKTGMISTVAEIISLHRVRLSNGKEYASLKLEVI